MRSQICARCSIAAVCLVEKVEVEWQVWMCRRCARLFVWLRTPDWVKEAISFGGNYRDYMGYMSGVDQGSGSLREYSLYHVPPCCMAASLPMNECYSCRIREEMDEKRKRYKDTRGCEPDGEEV